MSKRKDKKKNNITDERKESDLSLVTNMFNSSSNNEKTMDKLKSDDESAKVLDQMNQMWNTLKQIVKENPKFIDLTDKDKLKFFREHLKYGDIMNDHPIVTRYLICMGQYNSKAFKRFLFKVKNTPIPPGNARKKGEMEDIWIRRQADYVRYLWESYQKKHFSHSDGAAVWQDTYTKLKGEFDDFRNLHKKAEEKVKEDKIVNNALNLKELLERLHSGAQSIDPNDEKMLLLQLKNKVYARRFKNTMEELKNKVKLIEHVCEGVGKNKDNVVKDDQPKITMIETVDAEKYDLYDDKYKQPTSRDKEIEKIRSINDQ